MTMGTGQRRTALPLIAPATPHNPESESHGLFPVGPREQVRASKRQCVPRGPVVTVGVHHSGFAENRRVLRGAGGRGAEHAGELGGVLRQQGLPAHDEGRRRHAAK